jgi:hypothetical protein
MKWPATSQELLVAGYRTERNDQHKPHWDFCRGRTCRAKILWLITPKGARMPVTREADGTWQTHFANCPDRKRFLDAKKKRQQGAA